MAKQIKVSELPDYDPAEYLHDEEDIAAYLTAILDENDTALLAAALADVARARKTWGRTSKYQLLHGQPLPSAGSHVAGHGFQ